MPRSATSGLVKAVTLPTLLRTPLTDLDVARLFAYQYTGRIMHVGNSWFTWAESLWELDRQGTVFQYLAEFLDALVGVTAGAKLADANLAKRLLAFRSDSRMRSLLEVTSHLPEVSRVPEMLDAQPGIVNFENGTLDVATQRLRPHNPNDFITRKIAHRYDPDAPAPRFERFIDEITGRNHDLALYLRKALGQALLGSPLRAQKAFFLVGDGANGKSVLIESVKHALGPYATTIPGQALLGGRGRYQDPRNTFARLQGVLMAFVSELDEHQELAEGTLKSITGGDEITARFLYKDEFTFHPVCTPIIATNHLPRAQGTDYGLRRRLVAIPFPVTFHPNKQDAGLVEALKAEAPGILRWLVEGAAMFCAEGLPEIPEVDEATSGFWRVADPVRTFLQARTRPEPAGSIKSADLYAAFADWSTEHGSAPMSWKAFGDSMTRHGFSQDAGRRTKNSAGNIVYLGISLAQTMGAAVEAARPN